MTFLDEITSGLDNATAYEIEKRLLNEDMTIINITHRYNKELMQNITRLLLWMLVELWKEGRLMN